MEEEILKSKENEQIKNNDSQLINLFGDLIKNTISKINSEKIMISYIKYYFFRVVKFLENNENDKIIESFNQNFIWILDEIQYINKELIFEIVEIFVDNKNLYSKCIVQLLDRYYEKITNKFYKVNIPLINKPTDFQKVFNDLTELKNLIELLQRFFKLPIEYEKKGILFLSKMI